LSRIFQVTFDYRCPFARNAHEAVLDGLEQGRDWEVTFRPFSLDQTHVADGEPDVWDRPEGRRGSGLVALQWGVTVRDHFPDRFGTFHRAVFAARHDHGRHIEDETVLRSVADGVGLDGAEVARLVKEADSLGVVAREHAESVEEWGVWGVPTFIQGEVAVFMRLMERGNLDDLDRALDLIDFENLNEFKHTSIDR